MTSLLIADDQALVRVGLRKILETEPELSVVGEAVPPDIEKIGEVMRRHGLTPAPLPPTY